MIAFCYHVIVVWLSALWHVPDCVTDEPRSGLQESCTALSESLSQLLELEVWQDACSRQQFPRADHMLNMSVTLTDSVYCSLLSLSSYCTLQQPTRMLSMLNSLRRKCICYLHSYVWPAVM